MSDTAVVRSRCCCSCPMRTSGSIDRVSVGGTLAPSSPTPLSTALAFLYRDFTAGFFWWEFVDVTKKLCLVGFFFMLHRGHLVQLIAATCLALILLLAQAVAHPYRTLSDNALAISCDFCLALMLVWCAARHATPLAASCTAPRAVPCVDPGASFSRWTP